MTVIVANDWTAQRESVTISEDGIKTYTGALVITFWEAIKQHKLMTNKKKRTEANYGSPGEIVTEVELNDEGELATKYYQVLHQHRITLNNIKLTVNGSSGWTSQMSDGSTLCLLKNREECRKDTETVLVIKQGKEVSKEKLVRHKLQTEEQLNEIFEGIPAMIPKAQRRELSEDDRKKMSLSLRSIFESVM